MSVLAIAVQSVPIPLPRDATGTETAPYKRDANGQLVLTALDETQLREIADRRERQLLSLQIQGIVQLSGGLSTTRKDRSSGSVRNGEYQERFPIICSWVR